MFAEVEIVTYDWLLKDAHKSQLQVKVKNEDLMTVCAPVVDDITFATHTVCDVVAEFFTGFQTSQRKCLECETSVFCFVSSNETKQMYL